MNTTVTYHYWTEWCDQKGSLFAQAHYFDSPAEARKAHGMSCEFLWTRPDYRRASVTDLYSIVYAINDQGRRAETRRTMIADGKAQVASEATLS
jgi:hypothetical protein